MTNEWMETTEPGIYAIGDIVGGLPQLAHVGSDGWAGGSGDASPASTPSPSTARASPAAPTPIRRSPASA